mgnify:CR=1 FL=1
MERKIKKVINNDNNYSKSPNRRPKIGLCLGSGSAKGLAHIGVLKVLHKNKIYPDYIAGTSIGAAIAALYASGHTPEEIEEISKNLDWNNIIDFDIPKFGLIKGDNVEEIIRNLIKNKKFSDLNIPLNVIAYNLSKKKEIIFSQGDVAKAVHASMCIPGIFSPTKIDNDFYVDGGVSNPAPFDILKKMGAEIIIAVDIYGEEKISTNTTLKEKDLFINLKEKMIRDELLNIKNYIMPQRWPNFTLKIISWIYDKLLYPARVLKMIAKINPPPITGIMYEVIKVLMNNLALEKFKQGNIDIKVTPNLEKLTWYDFDKTEEFVKLGEEAMQKKLSLLKDKIRNHNHL